MEFVDNKTVLSPLSGFASWNVPLKNTELTSLYFYTLPMNLFFKGTSLDFTKFESILNGLPENKYMLLRIYTDTPGSPSGLPDFLQTGSLSYTTFNNKGISKVPDWKNKNLISNLKLLWKTLGSRYDTNPKLGAVQGYGWGFWSEFHYYSLDESVKSKNTWFPNVPDALDLLDTLSSSFKQTPVSVGVALFSPENKIYTPETAPLIKKFKLGTFTDVLCGTSSIYSYSLFKNRDPTLNVLHSGEVEPASQLTFLKSSILQEELKKFTNTNMVISAYQFTLDLTKEDKANFISLANSMAPKYFISNLDYKKDRLTLTFKNNGASSFYRPLFVKCKTPTSLLTSNVDIGSLLPLGQESIQVTFKENISKGIISLFSPKLQTTDKMPLFNSLDASYEFIFENTVLSVVEINDTLKKTGKFTIPSGTYSFSETIIVIGKLTLSEEVVINYTGTGVCLQIEHMGVVYGNNSSIIGKGAGTGVLITGTGVVEQLKVDKFTTGISLKTKTKDVYPVIDLCTVTNCTGRGIWTQLVGRGAIMNCSSEYNGMDGIDCDSYSQNVVVTGNQCRNNKRYGIFIEENAQNIVCVSNITSGNDIGINIFTNATAVTQNNTIINHTSQEDRSYRIGALKGKQTLNTLVINSSGNIFNVQGSQNTGQCVIDSSIKQYKIEASGSVITIL
jgi:parallel beta-helix repeat protein